MGSLGPKPLPACRAGAEGEEMTKTPGEVQPPKHLTKAARDARNAFRQVDAVGDFGLRGERHKQLRVRIGGRWRRL